MGAKRHDRREEKSWVASEEDFSQTALELTRSSEAQNLSFRRPQGGEILLASEEDFSQTAARNDTFF